MTIAVETSQLVKQFLVLTAGPTGSGGVVRSFDSFEDAVQYVADIQDPTSPDYEVLGDGTIRVSIVEGWTMDFS